MQLKKISPQFSVCKVEDYSQVNLDSEFIFIGKTDAENSLVCPSSEVPSNAFEVDPDWRAFRIQGVLDFSLIGILSKLSTILAENKIGIFAVSTYTTDYILTKESQYEKALQVLEASGYEIIE